MRETPTLPPPEPPEELLPEPAVVLEELLKAASEQLEGFIGSNPNSPQTPDALLKLGYCLQRQASLLAQPQDKAKALASARARGLL